MTVAEKMRKNGYWMTWSMEEIDETAEAIIAVIEARDIALYVLSGILFVYAIPCIASDRWDWWRRSTTVKGVPVVWKARVFRCNGCDRIPVAGTDCSKPCSQCGGVYVLDGEECGSCVERFDRKECPQSKRWCGHHCNHVLTHDACAENERLRERVWVRNVRRAWKYRQQRNDALSQIERLQKDVAERMAVNVGLINENVALKKRLATGTPAQKSVPNTGTEPGQVPGPDEWFLCFCWLGAGCKRECQKDKS